MTAPCQACGEDPDLGKRCPVTELRHVPTRAPAILPSEPSPEEMAQQWRTTVPGCLRPDVYVFAAGVTAERSRSAAETAALRAALEEAQAAALAMKEQCAKVVDDARAGYPENYSMGRDPFERRLEALVSEIRALK